MACDTVCLPTKAVFLKTVFGDFSTPIWSSREWKELGHLIPFLNNKCDFVCSLTKGQVASNLMHFLCVLCKWRGQSSRGC